MLHQEKSGNPGHDQVILNCRWPDPWAADVRLSNRLPKISLDLEQVGSGRGSMLCKVNLETRSSTIECIYHPPPKADIIHR
jgi:hypothetical protein